MNEDVEFAGALIRLSLAVQYVLQDLSRQHELTPQQSVLMSSLLERPVGMAELSDRLHIEKSTLTGLVDRAEKRGLVHRTPDPGDRRALRVALTPAGRNVADTFYRAVTDALLAQLGELPAERVAELRSAVPPTATLYWDAVGCSARQRCVETPENCVETTENCVETTGSSAETPGSCAETAESCAETVESCTETVESCTEAAETLKTAEKAETAETAEKVAKADTDVPAQR